MSQWPHKQTISMDTMDTKGGQGKGSCRVSTRVNRCNDWKKFIVSTWKELAVSDFFLETPCIKIL